MPMAPIKIKKAQRYGTVRHKGNTYASCTPVVNMKQMRQPFCTKAAHEEAASSQTGTTQTVHGRLVQPPVSPTPWLHAVAAFACCGKF